MIVYKYQEREATSVATIARKAITICGLQSNIEKKPRTNLQNLYKKIKQL